MFGFEMAGTYDRRKVDRYEAGEVFVSTAAVTDAEKPYETAVCHPEYNNGKIIIVETYETRSEAQKGHCRWLSTMTAEKLPEAIVDCSSAAVALMADLAGDDWRTHKRTTPTKGTK